MILRSNNSAVTEDSAMLCWYFSIFLEKNGVICPYYRLLDVRKSKFESVWLFERDKSQHVFSSWYVQVCLHCIPLCLNAYVLMCVNVYVCVFSERHSTKPTDFQCAFSSLCLHSHCKPSAHTNTHITRQTGISKAADKMSRGYKLVHSPRGNE